MVVPNVFRAAIAGKMELGVKDGSNVRSAVYSWGMSGSHPYIHPYRMESNNIPGHIYKYKVKHLLLT